MEGLAVVVILVLIVGLGDTEAVAVTVAVLEGIMHGPAGTSRSSGPIVVKSVMAKKPVAVGAESTNDIPGISPLLYHLPAPSVKTYWKLI